MIILNHFYGARLSTRQTIVTLLQSKENDQGYITRIFTHIEKHYLLYVQRAAWREEVKRDKNRNSKNRASNIASLKIDLSDKVNLVEFKKIPVFDSNPLL